MARQIDRVVSRGTGYDGNYASQRAGDDAKAHLEHPKQFVNYGLWRRGRRLLHRSG